MRRRVCAEHGEVLSLHGKNEADERESGSTLSIVPSSITMSVIPGTSSADEEGKGITLRTSGKSEGDGKSAREELAQVAEREMVGGALDGLEDSEKRGL